MTLFDYYDSQIPEYYPTMYQDGYTPNEILYAHRKKFRTEYAEQENQIDSIKIVSEVKIK